MKSMVFKSKKVNEEQNEGTIFFEADSRYNPRIQQMISPSKESLYMQQQNPLQSTVRYGTQELDSQTRPSQSKSPLHSSDI